MDEADSFKLLEKVIVLLKEEGVLSDVNNRCKVIEFKHPNDLKNIIDFSLNTPITNFEKLLEICRTAIKYSVKTMHPNFCNQLYGGVDPFGLFGSWISEGLNTNQHTYEIAPVFTLTEQAIISRLGEKIGYKTCDGIFSPGGSISNMYGMVLARYKAFPDVKFKGVYAFNTLVAFASEDVHYSIIKAMHWLGIGINNLIKIKTDANGKMCVQDLENQIKRCKQEGNYPFFVNATAGTTVLGAIDPLNKVADICRKYNIWFHIDACYAGSLMFSNKYKNRLEGIERSDSISWNAHKMLGAPLQCSLFLTKHKELFQECNAASATYLFQKDKFYDISYDTGDKSIQCGRKVDAFKLWIMWKARGDYGFETLVDNAISCANYFRDQIASRDGFRLVLFEIETTAICFWFIPKHLRNQVENDQWKNELNKVAPSIKEKLTIAGALMIGYTPLGHKKHCNFFRMVTTCHPSPTYKDMEYVITQIEIYGNELSTVN